MIGRINIRAHALNFGVPERTFLQQASMLSSVGTPPKIKDEPSLSVLPHRRGYRLSCRAYEENVSYRWFFRPTAPAGDVKNPISTFCFTLPDLLLLVEESREKITGYYFCVITSTSSGLLTVSQLISLNVGERKDD